MPSSATHLESGGRAWEEPLGSPFGGRRIGVPPLGIAIVVGLVLGIAVVVVPPKYLVVLALSAAVLVSLLAEPFLGLLVVLVYVFLQPSALMPELTMVRAQRLLVMAVVAAWALTLVWRRERVRIGPGVGVPMLCFLAALAASTPLALWPGQAVTTTLDFAKTVATYMLIVNLAGRRNRLVPALWALLLSFAVICTLQVLGHFGIYSSPYVAVGQVYEAGGVQTRSGGVAVTFLGNPDDFAVGLLFALPFAGAFALVLPKRGARLAAAGLFLLMSFCLALTASRGGAIGAAAAALAAWRCSPRKLHATLLIAVLGVCLWFGAPPTFRQRMSSLTSGAYKEDGGVLARYEAWAIARRMFAEHPLTGVGAGGFEPARWTEGYRQPGQQLALTAHSVYYLLAAEAGLVGVAAFAFLVLSIFLTNRATRARVSSSHHPQVKSIVVLCHALDISTVGYLVSGAFITVLYYPYLYLIAGFVAALSLCAEQEYGPPPEVSHL